MENLPVQKVDMGGADVRDGVKDVAVFFFCNLNLLLLSLSSLIIGVVCVIYVVVISVKMLVPVCLSSCTVCPLS